MTQTEAFKRYLDDCDKHAIVPCIAGAFNFAWTEALAQLEQEPVAYCDIHHLPEPCVQCAKEHEGYNIPPQPKEQEPVAWLHWLHGPVRLFLNKDEAMMELDRLNREYPVDKDARQMKPLYTTPPQRKPLTLVELSHIFASIPSVPFDGEWQLELARAIEAAHGIKE